MNFIPPYLEALEAKLRPTNTQVTFPYVCEEGLVTLEPMIASKYQRRASRKMSYFDVNAHLSHLYSVKSGLFDEKTVISQLLEVLETLGRWQINRQTCTLKVKKFELIDGNKNMS